MKCIIQPTVAEVPSIPPSMAPMFMGGMPIRGATSISMVMAAVATKPATRIFTGVVMAIRA